MIEIASLGILATIVTGTIPHTDYSHHQEAQQIMVENIYQYPDSFVFAAHSDMHGRIFHRLPEVVEGESLTIGGQTLKVSKTMVIEPSDTWLLRRKGHFLFTCINGVKQRFLVILEEL